MSFNSFCQAIQRNCDISDAKGSSLYSICTLFLRLRNFYKWEKKLNPWDEPDRAELLNWIAEKEKYWQSLENKSFSELSMDYECFDPFSLEPINAHLGKAGLVYGAGYGRSMKPIFFLAETLDDTVIEGCRTIILGRELTRELAAPFAMLQDGNIYIRREPLRCFFWDQITDIRPLGRGALKYALGHYDLLDHEDKFDRDRLIEKLDTIVDHELMTFVYHEIGELQETTLDSEMYKNILVTFAQSPIEFLARALKDILADTHPNGMLSYILAEQKGASLGFYVTFLDGLRKVLFPELGKAFQLFMEQEDWEVIRKARDECRSRNLVLAQKLENLENKIDTETPDAIRKKAEKELLAPLGL